MDSSQQDTNKYTQQRLVSVNDVGCSTALAGSYLRNNYYVAMFFAGAFSFSMPLMSLNK